MCMLMKRGFLLEAKTSAGAHANIRGSIYQLFPTLISMEDTKFDAEKSRFALKELLKYNEDTFLLVISHTRMHTPDDVPCQMVSVSSEHTHHHRIDYLLASSTIKQARRPRMMVQPTKEKGLWTHSTGFLCSSPCPRQTLKKFSRPTLCKRRQTA